MALTKAQAADFLSAIPDEPPSETRRFAPAGGDVIVRGMGLAQRLQLTLASKRGFDNAPEMLSACVFVLDEDGQEVPMASQGKWKVIGARFYTETLDLMAAINRLSGIEDASGN